MTPTTINIYQTSKCNLKCNFCKRQQSAVQKTKDMSAEFLKEVLDALPSIQSACIAGFGEPLMSRSLYDVLYLLHSRKIFTSLITNGTMIGNQFSLVKLFDAVNISLNAATKQEHTLLTKRQFVWDEILAGARALVAKKVPLSLSFVIGNSNYKRVGDYAQLAQDIGATATFHNLLPHSTSERAMESFYAAVIQSGSAAAMYLESFRNTLPQGVVSHWPEPIVIDVPPATSKCSGPFHSIGIDGDGNVSVCPRCWGPHETGVKWDGKECLDDPVFAAMRYAVSNREGLDQLCRNCFGHYRG